ncbi:PfkB family carbohydrate kinase, partial [Salmonella enterica]|uniref:PfkB family carbohydrate kinase n=1 Tax=Salmonella enterica TaxID=28901 RepID=UPI0039EA56F1
PPGTPADAVSELVTAVRAAGALVLLDTSGPLLLAGIDGGADLVKPNHHELREATGADTVDAGARELLDRGASAVAVSRGEDGVTLFARS